MALTWLAASDMPGPLNPDEIASGVPEESVFGDFAKWTYEGGWD